MAEGECHICQMAQAGPDETVYRDDLWTATTVADAPGFIMLMTNRHAEGAWSLEPAEADKFGSLLVEMSSAVRKVCSAACVYVMYLGENALHFHTMLVSRTADAPPELRGPGVIAKIPELKDRPEALRIAGLIRAEIAGS